MHLLQMKHPLHHKLLQNKKNETTIPNTESALQSAASNDIINDENGIEMLTMSNKRPIHEDSSEEDPASPRPAKKAATGSSAGEQSGTHVPKGRGGGDLPKISAYPANAPQPKGRGSSQGDKSPALTPRFSTNTGEGSASSAQGGRNRGPLNRHPPLKPPGTIKTATKDKTKSKEKNTPSLIMAHNYIIQWNCRGLRNNREDIELLISKYSPAAICLQETLLTPHQTQTFKHYSAYYKSGIHGHGGVCILVENSFIHSQVQFQADLQAVAVCITFNNKTYTVTSVYVPRSETLNELAFDRRINSFSSRYLILGDFNGHNHLWGANQENERGKVVEKLIDRHSLMLLNDSVHTRFDTYHQTSSLLDLSVCHPSIYMDVACEVSSDR